MMMSRDKGVSTGHRGQHGAGKHTKAAQKAAKAAPRAVKTDAILGSKTKTTGTGDVYGKGVGLLGRLFGKKSD